MKKGLAGGVLTALLLVGLAGAAPASARATQRSASAPGWGLAQVPPGLLPAARVLLRAPRWHRIPHWSRSPGKAQDISARAQIVGGTGAVQGQFGFMAFIEYFDSNGNPLFLCSGTLVSSNVVLTAGHCAVDESTGVTLAASGYRVVTGAVDWTDAAHRTVSAVSRVVVNPGFSTSSGEPINDAALLILSSPVGQPAIPLWGRGQVAAGERATMAGWGETFADQATPQTVLQWARTVVQSPSYCAQFNAAFQASRQLCVVNPPTYDTATCNGDSGGPLLAKSATNELLEIGITSVGPANCNAQTADYFTAVLPIQPWVSSQVNAVSSNPRIPRLSFADARRHVRQTLTGILGSTFSRRRNYNVACTRESAIKIRCSVSFTSGRSYYYGPVTIRYILVSDQVRWTDRYVIHRVNRHCYFQSGHRSSCRTRTRSGSW